MPNVSRIDGGFPLLTRSVPVDDLGFVKIHDLDEANLFERRHDSVLLFFAGFCILACILVCILVCIFDPSHIFLPLDFLGRGSGEDCECRIVEVDPVIVVFTVVVTVVATNSDRAPVFGTICLCQNADGTGTSKTETSETE